MTAHPLTDSRDGVDAVIDAIVAAAGNAGVDDVVRDRLRSLRTAGPDALLKSPAELGLDSLTWLEVLTVLEERFDVLLPDAVAVTPASRTVLGLARALADCRRAER
ncbi:phosphopantetheine-binding protein [Streptomyces sp. NPDC003327]